MCLERLDSETKVGDGVGYKVFKRRSDGKLQGEFNYCIQPYPVSKWIKDAKTGVLNWTFHPSYPTGFHVFTRLDDAMFWAYRRGEFVRKVKFSDVVASGTQSIGSGDGDAPIVVARKMYIFRADAKMIASIL